MGQVVAALDDPNRLGALRSYEILDTQPEPPFDRLAKLAAHICGTPYAAITFVDGTRSFYKATVGFTDDGTLGASGFCSDAAHRLDLFVVADASQDERFTLHPLVTGPTQVRFYAGAPVITADGHVLGTLCVLDRTPRQLTKEQGDGLLVLASEVVTELELRRTRRTLEEGTFRQDPILSARYKADEFLRSLVQKLEPCDAGRYSIAIDASGNVSPCLAFPSVGNLLESSLSEILGRFDRDAINRCSENSSCNRLDGRVVGTILRHPVTALRTARSFTLRGALS